MSVSFNLPNSLVEETSRGEKRGEGPQEALSRPMTMELSYIHTAQYGRHVSCVAIEHLKYWQC